MLRRIKNLILHRQPVVNNLSAGPWLKGGYLSNANHPINYRMFSYSTPPTGSAPVSGEIVHGDNLLNKLAINHTDLNGNNIQSALAQLGSGDFIAIGGTTYNIIAPIFVDGSGTFSYITVSPSTQRQDGVYQVTAWKSGTNPPVAWSPLALFAAGEQGAWYDPSDFSTMFQTSSIPHP